MAKKKKDLKARYVDAIEEIKEYIASQEEGSDDFDDNLDADQVLSAISDILREHGVNG